MSAPEGSRLRRWRTSLAMSGTEQEADDVRAEAERFPMTRIADLADREIAEVCGRVRAVTLPPRASVPKLVVELYDGTQPLNLIWLGRRAIIGIEPGTFLTARGRVTFVGGIPTIYNPSYAIIPRGS